MNVANMRFIIKIGFGAQVTNGVVPKSLSALDSTERCLQYTDKKIVHSNLFLCGPFLFGPDLPHKKSFFKCVRNNMFHSYL